MGFWRIAWFSGGTERESVVASRVQSIKRTSADCQVTGNEVRPGKFYRDSWHNQIKITPGIYFLYFSVKRKRHTRSTSPAPGVERKEKERKKELYDFELLLSRVIRASRSLNTRLRSPVKRKKLCWYCKPLRHKLSVKSDVLR